MPVLRRHPLLILPLLLLALWLRALTPAGWMPVFAGDGVVMTLCSDAGGTIRQVDAGHDGKSAPEQPCAFAGLAPLALADAPALLPPVAVVATAAATITRAALRLSPLRHQRPPAQGPPALPHR
ncbi:MAG: hypothetical protein CFE37_05285 [Alphaproteobacteria bacterium PA4]|nr:MAG: hypothetical protein CFE37_05285 [Alphaproteobacteria bacterium PA4]